MIAGQQAKLARWANALNTMGRIPGHHEGACIALFEQVLGERALRRHTFDFLRGDPTPMRPGGTKLHVDAYFPRARVALEYMGKQHFSPNRLMDRRPGRAEQRLRYQERRATVLPQHGITLVRLRYDEPPTEETVHQKLAEAQGIGASKSTGAEHEMKSIGIEDLRVKLAEYWADTSRPEAERMGRFFEYIATNSPRLSEDAGDFVNALADQLAPEIRRALAQAPDTTEIRDIRRMFARVEGRHWDAKALIAALESPPRRTEAIVPDARVFFEQHLQGYFDLLWTVVQHRHSGAAAAVRISMFTLCADELLAGMHLALRGYASQAYTHCRIIWEALGLIELFSQTPEAADEWVSLDPKMAWNKFSPNAVRQKSGTDLRDPFYSFLSEYGSHVTWGMIRNRLAKKNAGGSEVPQILLIAGGSPYEHDLVHSVTLCLHLLVALTVKLVAVLGNLIPPADTERVMLPMVKEYAAFNLKHFVEWARRENLDAEDMEIFLRGQLASLEKLGPPGFP